MKLGDVLNKEFSVGQLVQMASENWIWLVIVYVIVAMCIGRNAIRKEHHGCYPNPDPDTVFTSIFGFFLSPIWIPFYIVYKPIKLLYRLLDLGGERLLKK